MFQVRRTHLFSVVPRLRGKAKHFFYECVVVHHHHLARKFHWLSSAVLSLAPAVIGNARYPAFPAPHGVTSNIDNPVSQKGPRCNKCLSISLVLFFAGMRIYTKHNIIQSLSWDDCRPKIALWSSRDRYLHPCGGEHLGAAAACLGEI